MYTFVKIIHQMKDIKGYEGAYAVNEQGEVFSHPKKQRTGCGFLHHGIKLKPQLTIHGYQLVSLYKDGKSKALSVHRIVCQTFIKNTDNKKYVNHKNGIKTDNSVDNLEWVTASENMRHAFRTKLHIPYKRKVGTEEPRSKLNEKQVREIRKSDLSLRKLAKIYDIHHAIIYGIKKGTRYFNVK